MKKMKNKCLTEEQINDYLDRQLSNGELGEVEEHLKACKHCRDRVLRLRVIFDGLERIKVPELPENFTEKTMSYVKAEKERRKKEKILTSILAASFIVFLFLTTALIRAVSGPEAWSAIGLDDMKQGWNLFINIFNAFVLIKSGLRGGQFLNGLIWGGIAIASILILKLREKTGIIHNSL